MHHILGQDDLLLLAHIVYNGAILNMETPHSNIFDAYSQDTHDSSYPFYYMCVHAFQSNYPQKDCTHLGGASFSHVSLKVFIISMHILFEDLVVCCHQLPKRGRLKAHVLPWWF